MDAGLVGVHPTVPIERHADLLFTHLLVIPGRRPSESCAGRRDVWEDPPPCVRSRRHVWEERHGVASELRRLCAVDGHADRYTS